jgi:hypothetical protein
MRSTLSGWEVDLTRWLKPFLDRLGHKARRRMCPLYVAGLIGPGDRKSVQPMAERLAPGDYDQLHHFVAAGIWDAAPLEKEAACSAVIGRSVSSNARSSTPKRSASDLLQTRRFCSQQSPMLYRPLTAPAAWRCSPDATPFCIAP